MATIKVNSVVMREKASAFKTVANSIKTFTNEMSADVENLKSVWEGESSAAALARFKSLSENFEEIYNTIIAYADFLDQAAEAYDAAETSNTQGIQG